jgi:AbrB family looped-hinge helix DNA binding protein
MGTKLSTKGQLIIPLEVRRRHRWRAGTELLVEDHGTHVVLRAAPEIPRTRVRDLIGCTGYEGPRRSLEEMEEAIARGARSRG